MINTLDDLLHLSKLLSGKQFGEPKFSTESDGHEFEKRNIHPEIAAVSQKLFDDGHYQQASLQALILIDNVVKAQSGYDDSGFSLMMNAFNESKPLITLNANASESEVNEQAGFKHIFAGTACGIRNPRAHEVNWPETMDECLDHLVLASMLMRKIDHAV